MSELADVAKIAELARLDIEPDQLESVSANFSEILEYFNRLKEVDTTGVEPVYHATLFSGDTLAEDIQEPDSILMGEVMGSAPQSKENQFRVPKVIE